MYVILENPVVVVVLVVLVFLGHFTFSFCVESIRVLWGGVRRW